jgi:hypothetical protein
MFLQIRAAVISDFPYLSIQAQDTLFGIGAADKVVTRSTGVRYRASIATVRIEHHAVRTRRAYNEESALYILQNNDSYAGHSPPV